MGDDHAERKPPGGGGQRAKRAGDCFYELLIIAFMVCASRKTFARALAWAQAEAKRGMGSGE